MNSTNTPNTGSWAYLISGNLFDNSFGSEMSRLLLQIVIIMILCRLLTIPFSYIRQPKVIPEIIAGILIGPTALGKWTWFSQNIFNSQDALNLELLSDIGLILFFFLMGTEMDLVSVRQNASKAMVISFGGFLAPFALSIGVSLFYKRYLVGLPTIPYHIFALFIGISMAATALPVLSRILIEKRLLHTRVGVIALASAAIDDSLVWAGVALITAILTTDAKVPLIGLYVFLSTMAFLFFYLYIVRTVLAYIYKIIKYRERATFRTSNSIPRSMVVISFVIAMGSTLFTKAIGIDVLFGAFVAGMSIPREDGFAFALTERLEDFVSIVLIPLYFAFCGLRVDLTAISTMGWVGCILLILCAFVGKVGGCSIAARLSGSSWKEALTIGALMNTKLMVELRILNAGYVAGFITQEIFSIHMVMAITVTSLTVPMLMYLKAPTQFSPDASGLTTLERREIPKQLQKNIRVMMAIPDMFGVSILANFLELLHCSSESNIESDLSRHIHIHLARFIPLTDRFSSVHMAHDPEEVLEKDAAITFFKHLGRLRRIRSSPHVLMTTPVDFPKELSKLAYEHQIDMIIYPWNENRTKMNHMNLNNSLDKKDTKTKYAFDIIEQVMRKSKSKMGVLVDRGYRPNTTMGAVRILVPFFGGPDDRECLLTALRMTGKNLWIHVLHICTLPEEEEGEAVASSEEKSIPLEHTNELMTNDYDSHLGEQDLKIIEYIKTLANESQKDLQRDILIQYTFQTTRDPIEHVKQEIHKTTYTFIILGHFGPNWNSMIQTNQESSTNVENESTHTTTTMWSMFTKSMNDLDMMPSSDSIKKNSKSEKALGPLGNALFKGKVGKANLLVIRCLRFIFK